jgi:organic radical activating enzyme
MKQLIEIKNSNIRSLRINYDLGNLCNFKCWYCFPGSNEGTVPWPNESIVKRNIVTLINYYYDSGLIDEVQLSLLGGEPTLWPKLGQFVEYVANNTKCKILIITNGSRTLRWWDEFGQYFDSITISVHHQQADTDHLITLASILNKKKIPFFFDVLMDHTAWDKCIDIVNKFKSSSERFIVFVKPININGVETYNTVQKKYLKQPFKKLPAFKFILRNIKKFYKLFANPITLFFSDNSKIKTYNENYFSHHLLNKFNGWECSIGVNTVFINRKGELSGSCNNLLYDLDFYYNINDLDFSKKFNPIIKPTICRQRMCLCPGEAALSKRKIFWAVQQTSKY